MNSIKHLLQDESGEDLVEYGMLAALLSIAALVTVRLLGPMVNAFYVIIRTAIA